MEFRFYSMNDNGALDLISTVDLHGDSSHMKVGIEQHFEWLVEDSSPPQVLVFCSGLGKLPGLFVAAEAVYVAHLAGKVRREQQVRTLVWLLEEAVPRY